jgi:hypothetical protein
MNERPPPLRRPVPSAGLARTLVGGACALAGFGALGAALVASAKCIPGPGGWTLSELHAWLDRQPVGAAFQALAALGLIVVVYLTASTLAVLLAGIAQAARLPRVGRLAELIAVPLVRRALAALLGLGITVVNTAAPAHTATPPAATMRPIPRPPPAAGPTPAPPPVATMRGLAPPPSPAPTETEPTWTICPGDHLWGLAERALREHWHRSPSDAEVAEYLALVVERNRDELAVPDHPDLVFPGQVFVRPAVPSR